MTFADRAHFLITRLARLDAAGVWGDGLNPVQIAALGYLARANRFSRAPSHLADYLGTTRGTMSQTMRSLERKGYVAEAREGRDRRSISYSLTEAGAAAAARAGPLRTAIATLERDEQARLETDLMSTLAALLKSNGGRSFGLCRSCLHHRATADGAYCRLLALPLAPEESTQICHEQVPA